MPRILAPDRQIRKHSLDQFYIYAKTQSECNDGVSRSREIFADREKSPCEAWILMRIRRDPFDSVIRKLGYLRNLGVNAVELMPSSEFASDPRNRPLARGSGEGPIFTRCGWDSWGDLPCSAGARRDADVEGCVPLPLPALRAQS
jgi:hypothetical protein